MWKLTLNIPQIILNGPEWFQKIGPLSVLKVQKVFALGGKINITGLIEVPDGHNITRSYLWYRGGIPNWPRNLRPGSKLADHKWWLFNWKEDLDTPIDYDTLIQRGSMDGVPGGIIVMDEDNCMGWRRLSFILTLLLMKVVVSVHRVAEGTRRLYGTFRKKLLKVKVHSKHLKN